MTGAGKTPAGERPASGRDQIAAFEDSEFGRLLGLHIAEARDGYARVEMDCSGKCNPHGVAHGGAIFSLADHAFGIASNCGKDHHTAVSVHIQYIAPARGLFFRSRGAYRIERDLRDLPGGSNRRRPYGCVV